MRELLKGGSRHCLFSMKLATFAVLCPTMAIWLWFRRSLSLPSGHQGSHQKSILLPSPSAYLMCCESAVLSLIIPFQIGEYAAECCVSQKFRSPFRYLFLIHWLHKEEWLDNTRHMRCVVAALHRSSTLLMPSPPSAVGLQILSQLIA